MYTRDIHTRLGDTRRNFAGVPRTRFDSTELFLEQPNSTFAINGSLAFPDDLLCYVLGGGRVLIIRASFDDQWFIGFIDGVNYCTRLIYRVEHYFSFILLLILFFVL